MRMSEIVSALGKGPGFLLLALIEVAITAILLAKGIDGTGIAAALGAINIPVYGGGAWKAAAEAKNGGGAK